MNKRLVLTIAYHSNGLDYTQIFEVGNALT
jgi:hypothetical protein